MIITIDGTSGTGKSTVAKKLAEKLRFIYFDTGAMYRTITYGIIKHSIAINDKEKLNRLLDNFQFEIKVKNGEKRYYYEGEDVTEEIRKAKVAAFVSEVSAIKEVRGKLINIQREFAKSGDAVFEGRDMGSFVFPKADLKIFLTAGIEIRAMRRYKELLEKFPNEEHLLEDIMQNVEMRDRIDSTRKASPLKKAEDAHEIDTSNLTIDAVVDQILNLL